MVALPETQAFKVCINEALEMGRVYWNEDSSRFINGNLDSISKEVKG